MSTISDVKEMQSSVKFNDRFGVYGEEVAEEINRLNSNLVEAIQQEAGVDEEGLQDLPEETALGAASQSLFDQIQRILEQN